LGVLCGQVFVMGLNQAFDFLILIYCCHKVLGTTATVQIASGNIKLTSRMAPT
jgi:hypothetical protein